MLTQYFPQMQQKGILLGIFGMGFFIIVAAILTKVYCLVPWLISYVYMNWYFREASVAVYVTNLPTIWPLLREVFPLLSTWGSSRHKTTTMEKSRQWGTMGSRARINSGDFQMKHMAKERGESQERINDSDSGKSVKPPMEIHRDVTFTVETESVERGNGGMGRWDRKNEIVTEVRGVN